jgi:anti-sigma-K factor RskA
MTKRPPDLDELLDDHVEPAERERLRRVHDLLVAAGPPPELSPVLSERSPRREDVYPLFPRRRRAAAVALAAALALVAFGAGFLVGDRQADGPTVDRVVAMTAPAGAARASLAIFTIDDAGNWPMELTVRDLEELPEGETYELWLTKGGKLAAPCGAFAVAGSRTVVPLTAPYRFSQFDGWVVVREGTTQPVLTT